MEDRVPKTEHRRQEKKKEKKALITRRKKNFEERHTCRVLSRSKGYKLRLSAAEHSNDVCSVKVSKSWVKLPRLFWQASSVWVKKQAT
jgi:hypothetical protein